MFCEIEFLPVGQGSRAGDAIVIRYGSVDQHDVMLVDGGFATTGEEIVEHLKRFGPNVFLRHVVLTHSDSDHASGLRDVLRHVRVESLWMHIPWLLSQEALHLFYYKQWTADNLSARIKKEYDVLNEIVELAVAQGTKIYYPFQGYNIGPFLILSPSHPTYLHLLVAHDLELIQQLPFREAFFRRLTRYLRYNLRPAMH